MLGSVVKALSEVDAQTPLVEALMTRHSSVLADIIDDAGPVSLERMRRMGKAITSSPDYLRNRLNRAFRIVTGRPIRAT